MLGFSAEQPALQLPCGLSVCPDPLGCRFFDIWQGVELTDVDCAAGVARLPTVVLESGGYGAVLRSADRSSTPAATFLTQMAALAANPLASFDDTWRPLQQQHIVPGLVGGCGVTNSKTFSQQQ